jgi:hypothetical protein
MANFGEKTSCGPSPFAMFMREERMAGRLVGRDTKKIGD